MKTRILISAIVLFCLACTNNKPLSDSEKQEITAEVKAVVDQIISCAEKADIETILKIGYDSPDNTFITPEGKSISYLEWSEGMKMLFGTIGNQKINTIADSYRVLDRNIVLYTNVSKTQMNLKDSSIIMQYPWNMFFIFKKIDNSWRWISGTEYGNEEIIKPAPLPKDMDQLELTRKLLGRWICEVNDTVITYDQKAFGKAQIVTVSASVKGKVIDEQQQLWGFDRIHNRINFMSAGKDGFSGVVSIKFITPTVFSAIPYENISNPDFASFRIDGEFTDPDTYVEKVIMNNETVRTYITRRVK